MLGYKQSRGLRVSHFLHNLIAVQSFERIVLTLPGKRYKKDSPAFRGSILWNIVSFNEHGVSQLKQRELKRRLKTKRYFKDFKFNKVVSSSTVRHRDDDFIYI